MKKNDNTQTVELTALANVCQRKAEQVANWEEEKLAGLNPSTDEKLELLNSLLGGVCLQKRAIEKTIVDCGGTLPSPVPPEVI